MAYSELIKNYERIRDYMREFFVNGFKSREEYSPKSARSYDNERRRVESWLGDAMSFRQTDSGKNVFISLDIREMDQNPLFRAYKAKSFTDRDITLFFYLMDVLDSRARLTASELQELISENYLHSLGSDLEFDLSTLRKKLREFEELGLILSEKSGNKLLYSKVTLPEPELCRNHSLMDAVRFFSEDAPLGLFGSFLSDRAALEAELAESVRFSHKHHYILNALDSEILLELFTAIRERRMAELRAVSRKGKEHTINLVPLKIYISTRQGRQYVLGYEPERKQYNSVRLDQIHSVQMGGEYPDYEAVRKQFQEVQKHLWGVVLDKQNRTEHLEMDVQVGKGEEYIVNRLMREARCGTVEQVGEETAEQTGEPTAKKTAEQAGEQTWRFSADVYDTIELLPWIRTFTGRITRLESSDGRVEELFYSDLKELKQRYTVTEGGGEDALS